MLKKILIGATIVAVLLIAFTIWRINTNNTDEPAEVIQDNQPAGDQQELPGQEEEKKSVVSESELARLKSQGVVSSDDKYYIQNMSVGFPKIISIETGEEYAFRPGVNYTKVSKVTWSGDGKSLAYLYQVPDPEYASYELFNIANIEDVTSQQFGNSKRVLTAGNKMDYVWADANTVLFYTLQNYDAAKKYYGNGTVGTYNLTTEEFGTPWKVEDGIHVRYVQNLYSMEISPNKNKFLYVQAVLNDDGSTNKREYVTVDYNGNVLKTTSAYDKNWYK
jgi:hypothetical protein